MKATKRHLVGRKIISVDFRPFNAGIAGAPRQVAYNPCVTLDNGRVLFFTTQETEVGEYGIEIEITTKAKRS